MHISVRHASVSTLFAGLLAAFVGFAGSFAVVVQGLTNVGASPGQVASGLMAACVAIGFGSILLSYLRAEPISLAWSTPGLAFLATLPVPEGGFPVAVGAFVVASVLIILSGLWRPLGRAVSAIPKPLAGAMLAGVLLPLCLAPFQAIAQFPSIALPIVVTWAVVGRIKKLLAVPAAVCVAAVLISLNAAPSADAIDLALTRPILTMPAFTVAGVTGIAIPLFIITMAGQNVTGIAVLSSFGYRPDPSAMFRWTGLLSLLIVPFAAPLVNLAAITAAICAGPDVHDDPARRYWAAFTSGILYLAIAVFAGVAVLSLSIAEPILIAAVAGLALLGALASSLVTAVGDVEAREAALVTFLATASGLTFLGIGGAFWGLLAGGALYLWDKRKA